MVCVVFLCVLIINQNLLNATLLIILVPENMKLPGGKEPRQIADEGFFVGKKPFISRSNINRMENRFVTQKVEYCHE